MLYYNLYNELNMHKLFAFKRILIRKLLIILKSENAKFYYFILSKLEIMSVKTFFEAF